MQWWDQNHCNHWATSVQTIPAGHLPTNSKLILNMFSIQTGNTDSPHLALNNRQLSASSQTVNHQPAGSHLKYFTPLKPLLGFYKDSGSVYVFYFQSWRCYNYRILTILAHLQYYRSQPTTEVLSNNVLNADNTQVLQ